MNAVEKSTERFKEPIISVNYERDEITVYSDTARAIPIQFVNPLTGITKHYMLRVTSKGGLCLV